MQALGSPLGIRFGLVLAVLLVPACRPPEDVQESNDTVSHETKRLAPLPVAESPLDRKAILQAAARAGSAAALGWNDKGGERKLDGKRFEVRVRFGCPNSGPPVEGGPFTTRYDAQSRRLQVRASPDLTEAEPWIAALGGDRIEAVEGFWMRKPWLFSAGCPEGSANALESSRSVPAAVSDWKVGLAQFFGATESRTMRRDRRAYEATKVLDEGELPSSRGYDLVLSGRLRELPDGRVIACYVLSDVAPPDCVISAAFDEVRIERADTREILAEWSP